MTSIEIKNGQGLTHGLKAYMESQGYTSSDGTITKDEWDKTIFKLGEIQKSRVDNKKAGIFSGGSENGNWGKNMVVKEGKVEFEQSELDDLMKTMGFEKSTQTKETTKSSQKEETKTATTGATTTASTDKTEVKTSILSKGEINTKEAKGTYTISQKEGSKKFTVTTDIELKRTPEFAKFFRKITKGTCEDGTKTYTTRYIDAPEKGILKTVVKSEVNKLGVDYIIYKDLAAKEAAGKTLTEFEKCFMNHFRDNLAARGFELNAKNEVIEHKDK